MTARLLCGKQFVQRLFLQQSAVYGKPIPPPHVSSRLFSSKQHSTKSSKVKKQQDPFHILGIEINDSYAVAKKRFLKIAMENHPDTASVDNDDDRKRLRDVFITARKAFEQLVEAPDGSIWHKDEAESMPDFNDWFMRETGYSNPFDVNLDPQTIKEVVEMTTEYGGGLDRDGGMWQLAKTITATHNAGGNSSSLLQLDAGVIDPNADHGDRPVRRRRKR